jgi:hypothetical protein
VGIANLLFITLIVFVLALSSYSWMGFATSVRLRSYGYSQLLASWPQARPPQAEARLVSA